MDDLTMDGETLLERLRGQPGAPELLDLAAGRGDVELVGGAVRDLLLGRTPRELDVVLADDVPSFARDLAESLGIRPGAGGDGSAGISLHERFGTAAVWWEHGRIDIACRRAEFYPAPGALPEVRAGTVEEDLRRRDFTVNAIAVGLGRSRRGELSSAPGAFEDLLGARLRVLHDRSFLDDPTRLLRLGRYLARLEFEPEERTAELAAHAIATGALSTVSGARIGAELRLALNEPGGQAALARLDTLGVLSALHPGLRLDEGLARGALAMLPGEGRADLLLLATVLLPVTSDEQTPSEQSALDLLDRLAFTAGDRNRALKAALLAPAIVQGLADAERPSQLRAAVGTATLEAVALAAALGDERGLDEAAAAAARWLSELRHVRLRIAGEDLLAAGLPAGPEIGERLELVLGRKLDGELADGREAELSAATEGLPSGPRTERPGHRGA